jgi:hypothetical protein
VALVPLAASDVAAVLLAFGKLETPAEAGGGSGVAGAGAATIGRSVGVTVADVVLVVPTRSSRRHAGTAARTTRPMARRDERFMVCSKLQTACPLAGSSVPWVAGSGVIPARP